MKNITKFHPFTLALVIFYAYALLNFKIGTYIGIFCMIIYIASFFVFKNDRQKLFPLSTLFIILLVEFYAYYTRINLLPSEVKDGSMENRIGAAVLLMLLIAIAPILSIPPTLLMARVKKKYLLLILPSLLVAAYWYFQEGSLFRSVMYL